MPERQLSQASTTDAEELLRFVHTTGLRRLFAVEWIDHENKKGKKPVFSDWQRSPALSDDQVRELAGVAEMVGVLLDGDTFVVDVDVPDAATGLDELPTTTRVESRRGHHLYLRSTDGPVIAAATWPGGDVKGLARTGKPTFVVAPGSAGGAWRMVGDEPVASVAGREWCARHVPSYEVRERGPATYLAPVQPSPHQVPAYLRSVLAFCNRVCLHSDAAIMAEYKHQIERLDDDLGITLEMAQEALEAVRYDEYEPLEGRLLTFEEWSPHDTNFNDYLFKQVGSKMWGMGFCEEAIQEEIRYRNLEVMSPIPEHVLYSTCGRPGAFDSYERVDEINPWAWWVSYKETKLLGGEVNEEFRVVSSSERYSQRYVPYVVKHVIHRGAVGQIIGPPASGKSFLAIDLALSMNHGLGEWQGYRVRGKRCVYVAMEGLLDLYQREHAWCIGHELPLGKLLVIEAPKFTLASHGDVMALSDSLERQGGADLVIMDTQSLVSRGIDENDSSEMSDMFRETAFLARSLDAAVALVHHTGWGEQSRERGSSAQFGAADWQIMVEASTWSVKKVKVGQKPESARAFGLKQVELPFEDEDGEPVTSAYATEYTPAERAEDQDQRALQRMIGVLSEVDTLTTSELRQRLGRPYAREDDRWRGLLELAGARVDTFRSGRGTAHRLFAEPLTD